MAETSETADDLPYAVVQAPDAVGEAFVIDRSTGESIGYVAKYVTDQGVHWSPHRKRGSVWGRIDYPYVGENRPTRHEAAALLWSVVSGREQHS